MIKCKSAEALDVVLNVEPVPFNKGFFAVDLTFFFMIHFATYATPTAAPADVRGLAVHSKKVILYGSEGSVKTFLSGGVGLPTSNMPVACCKAVDPIVLGCRIVECAPVYSEPLGVLSDRVAMAFGESFDTSDEPGKTVLPTLGLFTIVTLQRDVQIMIPAYDYVLPEKDCITSVPQDDPCEMFKRIKFPVNEFFPDDLCEVTGEAGCGQD